MRLRLVIGSLAAAAVVLAVLGSQATAAREGGLASACKLLKSALEKEVPGVARRLRFQAPVQNYEVRCLFTDNGRLVGWKWFAEFLGNPAPSPAVAKQAWQKGYAGQRRISNERNSGTDVTRLVGVGADNAYAVVVTDAKRDRNSATAVWQKGVWLGGLNLYAPRTTVFANDTDEVEDLLPVLMRGVPRTYA